LAIEISAKVFGFEGMKIVGARYNFIKDKLV
jgi:hypothetical protein